MSMREAKGNMYDFVTHTWNAMKGKCYHKCAYCYMNIFDLGKLKLDEREFSTDLGENNFIFVGSSTDMFAIDVTPEQIIKILNYCSKFNNKYLFQSKNPRRIFKMLKYLPKNSIIGTTIETNRKYKMLGRAPIVDQRAEYLGKIREAGFEVMVTIEPIFDFDVDKLVKLIKTANPSWVNIGADSKRNNVPEPSKQKVLELVKELRTFTEIRKKNNLGRILN
jgi:DNA repair photolyase